MKKKVIQNGYRVKSCGIIQSHHFRAATITWYLAWITRTTMWGHVDQCYYFWGLEYSCQYEDLHLHTYWFKSSHLQEWSECKCQLQVGIYVNFMFILFSLNVENYLERCKFCPIFTFFARFTKTNKQTNKKKTLQTGQLLNLLKFCITILNIPLIS